MFYDCILYPNEPRRAIILFRKPPVAPCVARRTYASQTALPNPSRQCSLGRATSVRCVACLVQCLYASLSRRIGLRDVSLAVPPHLPPPKPEVAYVANINLSYAAAMLTIASRPRNTFPRRILLLSKRITRLHTHRAKRGVWLPQLQRANIWYRRVLR